MIILLFEILPIDIVLCCCALLCVYVYVGAISITICLSSCSILLSALLLSAAFWKGLVFCAVVCLLTALLGCVFGFITCCLHFPRFAFAARQIF